MNSITIRKIVCLESEDEINRLREEQRRHQYASTGSSLLRDPLWREVVVSAAPERIKVSLGNIDESGARGNSINARYSCRTLNLTWPDLADTDGLEKLVQFEVLAVAKKVLEILAHLSEMSTAAHDILAV